MSQEPPTKEGKSNMDVSKKRSLGVLGQDEVSSVQFETTTSLSGRQNSRAMYLLLTSYHFCYNDQSYASTNSITSIGII